MLDQQTKKRIDDCRNILVGKITDPKSQVEQITIALIYKFMDDMDVQSMEMGGVPTYFIDNYKKYSWTNIFSPRIGGEEMLTLYAEGMTQMGQNPHLPQLFRDIFKNAYLPYRDPETLRLFLRSINEFHYDHSERLGDAFEYLLSVLGSQGDAGQFRTPRHIIDFIVKVIDPKKNETFMDPACGTSGFLISGYKHILQSNTNKSLGDKLTPDERKKLMTHLTGFDISPDMVRLSLVNLFLHGFPNPKVFEYDTLTSEDRWNEYFDVILANPPFMSPKGGIRPHKRFSIESNRAEVLFVDYIMEHLTPKGRAGIVVPEGIIFQSGTAYKSLRRMMVDKYLVGVISLPSGVFNPYSGVKTSILVLDRELSQKTDKIFFAKVENDGFDLGAQRRVIQKNDLPLVTESITKYLDGLRNGKSDEVEGLSFVSKEQILGSTDVGLSYDRYSTENRRVTEYEKVFLGDKTYFEIYSGGTPKTEIEQYWDGDIPWVSLVDLPQDELISTIRNTKRKITALGLKNSSAKIIPKGSVIVSTRATIGRVGLNEIDLCTNQGFKNIVIKDRCLVDSTYLSFIITSIKQRLLQLSSGGTFKEVSKSKFETIEIPLPPIEVQEEIVRELEQYQKIIDGAKQVVDNYKPVIDIDPSWEMKELGEICEFVYGFTDTAKDKGDYRYIRITDIDDNGLLKMSEEKYIIKSKENQQYVLSRGDLVVARTGATYGKCLYFDSDIPSVYASYLIKLNLDKNRILSKYYWTYSQSLFYETQKKKLVTGGGQPQFNANVMKDLIVPLPSVIEQEIIIEKVNEQSKLIEGNKKLIEIYTQKIQDRINKIWGD